MESIIEQEREINEIRNHLPDNKNLDKVRFHLCQAQNELQKQIETLYPPANWKHVRSAAPVHSVYDLQPSE